MVDLVFWGGTGQAKVLRPVVEDAGHRVVLVFDRNPALAPPLPGVPLLSDPGALRAWLNSRHGQETGYAVTIGGDGGPVRCGIGAWLETFGLVPVTAAHERAWIDKSARIGPGCQILALAAVAVEATLGRHCIVNTAASVDHEGQLGDGVHLMPGATLAGCVVAEDYVTVGTNATILPRVRLGRGAFIGAGAVVRHDVPAGAVVAGNPARAIRQNEPPAGPHRPFPDG
jgi:sugar O-acyltransferase (sialic acid O-acetyltransferase NeuD family)